MEVGNLLGEWNHEDWEVVDDDDDDAVAPTTAARNYIDNMRSGSGLHLRKREATQQAYNRHDERGLFGLFVTEKLKATWRTWTNIILVAKGEAPATVSEIDAYIGLEMAMSLVPITDIKEFWSDKTFQGHADFKATMSRTRFQVIRGSFQLHPQYGNYGELVDTANSSDTEEAAAAASKASAAREAAANAAEAAAAAEVASTAAEAAAEAAKAAQAAETAAEAAEAAAEAAEAAVDAADAAAAMVGCVHGSDTIRTDVHENEMTGDLIQTEGGAERRSSEDEEKARQDPLRHSRLLLEHFQRRFAAIAVPYGISSIDEIGVRTKARTLARSFMPLKPDKFAIRFYAVVGWESLYVHSFWDNGSGNTMPTTAAQRYTKLFPSLRHPLHVILNRPDVPVDPNAAAALWVAMIAHQTKLHQSTTGRRLVVCDNFYTRHALARAVFEMTDGEVRMLGTVRQDWVGRLNHGAVADSVKRVAEMPRGSWELIAAVDSELDSKQARAAHARMQKKLPKHLRTAYAPPVRFADRAGFIVFHDKQPVIFYTNDLARTPSARVLGGDNDEAIECCNGLYPIRRWTGNEVMHRATFMAPTPVAAYNIGMNGVDRVDQLRSTNPTRRKEMRLSMSMFTWLLDLSIINAFALMGHIEKKPNAPKTLREFKRRVCESLTSGQRSAMAQREEKTKKRRQVDITPDQTAQELHILTPNSKKHSSGKLVCHLCSLQGLKTAKSPLGCTQCRVGYHAACFAVAHYKEAFENPTPSVAKALEAIRNAEGGNAPSKTRRRLNNSTTSLDGLTLPN